MLNPKRNGSYFEHEVRAEYSLRTQYELSLEITTINQPSIDGPSTLFTTVTSNTSKMQTTAFAVTNTTRLSRIRYCSNATRA